MFYDTSESVIEIEFNDRSHCKSKKIIDKNTLSSFITSFIIPIFSFKIVSDSLPKGQKYNDRETIIFFCTFQLKIDCKVRNGYYISIVISGINCERGHE